MSSTLNTSSYSSLSTALNKCYLDSLSPRCFYGQTAVLMTAYKEENPGRRFYACHYFTVRKKCNLFSWHDLQQPCVGWAAKLVLILRQALIRKKDINSHNGLEKQDLWTTITDLRSKIDVLRSNEVKLIDEINSWKLKHEKLKLEIGSFKREKSGTWVQIVRMAFFVVLAYSFVVIYYSSS
ncbi:hypothetical protein ACFE04_026366 [Oxalis oulophora]